MIDAPGLVKVIINEVVYYYSILKLIVTNQELLFILKFWSLLYYFLGIKKKLLRAFDLQIYCQTERENNIIEMYLRVFVN